MPHYPEPAPRWATLDQAAEYIGLRNPRSVRRWIAEGRIPGFKINERTLRVNLNDIDRAMRQIPVGQDADA